jgi:phage gpG-like protein
VSEIRSTQIRHRLLSLVTKLEDLEDLELMLSIAQELHEQQRRARGPELRGNPNYRKRKQAPTGRGIHYTGPPL